jgi:hypothetical protein
MTNTFAEMLTEYLWTFSVHILHFLIIQVHKMVIIYHTS